MHKLKSLDKTYLEGIIDGTMADFHTNNRSIPQELVVGYTTEVASHVVEGMLPGKPKSVKITFSWDNGRIEKDEETNFAESKRDTDEFVVYAEEKITNLQEYINNLLDRLTT